MYVCLVCLVYSQLHSRQITLIILRHVFIDSPDHKILIHNTDTNTSHFFNGKYLWFDIEMGYALYRACCVRHVPAFCNRHNSHENTKTKSTRIYGTCMHSRNRLATDSQIIRQTGINIYSTASVYLFNGIAICVYIIYC